MEAMERYSLTDGVLVRDYLLPLLNATQTQHTSFMGSFTDSVTDEDNHIRLAALRETFKLRGAYPKEEGSGPSHLSITLNNIAVTE